ncbi:MAG: AMMECR1 domain-containing protein [Thermoplasmata archaeon]
MEDIIRFAVANGLRFKVTYPENIDIIPDNTFGVFVGVERSEYHRLKSWPENVHGCMGYWDYNYNNLQKDFIMEQINTVSYDATWNDERRKYFPHSIYVDLYAKYKVYFMLNPVKQIDPVTGEILQQSDKKTDIHEFFDNKRFGLIVENGRDKFRRATYLPEVFPNKNWEFIKESILKKAYLVQSEDVKFYAYECAIYSLTLVDYLVKPIQKFVNQKYDLFVPFRITKGITIIDKTEHVRNLSSIYEFLLMDKNNYKLENSVLKKIARDLKFYKSIYLEDKHSMRHASVYLMLGMYLYDQNDQIIEQIANELLDQLRKQELFEERGEYSNFTQIEQNFEMGQILMGLIIIGKGGEEIVQKFLNKISKNIETDTMEIKDIDIFRYNWYSKLASSIGGNFKYLLLNKIITYINKFKNDETNYYAVEFESLSTLYPLIDEINKIRSEEYISNLLTKLESVRNMNGLYEFKDGSMRVDITGHVLSGFFSLLSVFPSGLWKKNDLQL